MQDKKGASQQDNDEELHVTLLSDIQVRDLSMNDRLSFICKVIRDISFPPTLGGTG